MSKPVRVNYSGGRQLDPPAQKVIDIIVESTQQTENTTTTVESTTVSTDDFETKISFEKSNLMKSQYLDEFEKLRNEDESKFNKLMSEIKEFYDKVKSYNGTKECLDSLYEFYKNSISPDLLAFSVYKAVRHAILEISDPDLCHLFFLKMNIKLVSDPYSHILCEYLTSLSDIDFLSCDDEEMKIYTTIIDLMVHYGDCNINCVEPAHFNTPLHIAVILRQYQFIILLLKFNCTTFKTNDKDMTALDMALYLSSSDIIKDSDNKFIYKKIAETMIGFGAEKRYFDFSKDDS